MKREYFGMIFIIAFAVLTILANYLFGDKVYDYLSKFIIVWTVLAFYVGQHSMNPKAF